MAKWINFVEQSSKGKTKIFKVFSKEGNLELGVVKWHGPWRIYAFHPEPGTLFEIDCLSDITEFLKELMEERKKLKESLDLKHIKLFESFQKNFVGIHCSPRSFNDDQFYGQIIDEYYMTFQQILKLIQFDYKEAKEYLAKIESLEDGLSMEDDSVDLIYDIASFFADNNLEWIFVSKKEPLTKYGENCYDVYFNDLSNVYSMEDELTEDSKIYIYNSKTDRPILKKREE